MIGADKGASPIPQHHGYGTSPMSPREPQDTPPKTLAMNSSRDMLEKLRREIDRLAGSIIRQEIVDHGLNAAMTAWHLTDWVWRENQGSTRRPTLTARAGRRLENSSNFKNSSNEAAPSWPIAKTSPSPPNISPSRSSRCFPPK